MCMVGDYARASTVFCPSGVSQTISRGVFAAHRELDPDAYGSRDL